MHKCVFILRIDLVLLVPNAYIDNTLICILAHSVISAHTLFLVQWFISAKQTTMCD